MSRTEQILEDAHKEMSGVLGTLCLMLVARRGVTRSRILWMCSRLRRAADTLERLT